MKLCRNEPIPIYIFSSCDVIQQLSKFNYIIFPEHLLMISDLTTTKHISHSIK